MEKRYINPPDLFATPLISRAIAVKGASEIVYLAGVTPADESYNALHPGDLRAQYDLVKAQCGKVLAAAGATWADVVSVRTFVTNIDEFVRLFRAGKLQIPGTPGAPPCSTLVEVSRLSNPGFMVEMEVVAAIG